MQDFQAEEGGLMEKKKFRVVGGGDQSVGIPESDVVVTFDGNIIWDKQLVERTKELLKEWDDNGADVQTEEEFDEDGKER